MTACHFRRLFHINRAHLFSISTGPISFSYFSSHTHTHTHTHACLKMRTGLGTKLCNSTLCAGHVVGTWAACGSFEVLSVCPGLTCLLKTMCHNFGNERALWRNVHSFSFSRAFVGALKLYSSFLQSEYLLFRFLVCVLTFHSFDNKRGFVIRCISFFMFSSSLPGLLSASLSRRIVSSAPSIRGRFCLVAPYASPAVPLAWRVVCGVPSCDAHIRFLMAPWRQHMWFSIAACFLVQVRLWDQHWQPTFCCQVSIKWSLNLLDILIWAGQSRL